MGALLVAFLGSRGVGLPAPEGAIDERWDHAPPSAVRVRVDWRSVAENGEWRVAALRSGGCTIDIECRDADPCTLDHCVIEAGAAGGAGACQHDPVTDGQPGDCDDGLYCNGYEVCSGGQCQAGSPIVCCEETGPEVCSETFATCSLDSLNAGARCTHHADCQRGHCEHCRPDCRARRCSGASANAGAQCTADGQCPGGACLTNDAVCADGNPCNGDETCDAQTGDCLAGDNPCGYGAECYFSRCDGGEYDTQPCHGSQDCQGGICVPGPVICRTGRCCSEGAAPTCTFATLADCAGDWYAGDLGWEQSGVPSTGHCGGQSSEDPPEPWGCPKYSSGFSQKSGMLNDEFGTMNFAGPGAFSHSAFRISHSAATVVGPVSFSPAAVTLGGFVGPLNRVGDDYAVVDGGYFALDALRFVGGVRADDAAGRVRVRVEFYDDLGGFVRGVVLPAIPGDAGEPRIIVVEFQPEPVLPPSGYVVWSIAETHTPEASLFLMATDDADVGDNDAGLLWINDGPVTNPLAPLPGRVAFELVGDATGPPAGACCDRETGACDSVPEWVCRGRDGVAHPGIECAQCVNGANAGVPCRTCQGGSEPGDFACGGQTDCDARGLGGSCLPDQTLCGTQGTCSNDAGRLCTISPDCVVYPGRCSNTGSFCATDADCPDGACGGPGTCLPTACQSIECEVGACCDPNTGDCAAGQSDAECAAANGVFLGYGSSCDPNCCLQPQPTGADQPAAAVVTDVEVPAPGGGPLVITICGDNSAASSTAAQPDTCFGPAESGTDERGWFEAFHLDACADVRIDSCCSEPGRDLAWAFLATDTTCTGRIAPTTPADLFAQPETGNGEPYCADANTWQWYSHLSAGTYFFPIRSAGPGTLGPYQLHITVDPCPVAACCLFDGGCTDGVRRDECETVGGLFVAPPQKATTVAMCLPGLCDTGACCLGPGACRDAQDNGGVPMTRQICESPPLGGTFTPNAQCGGGRCSGDFDVACRNDADCVALGAGQCEGDAAQFAQPDPCRVCGEFDSGHCRSQGALHHLADSSAAIPTKMADDVLIHQTGILESVCVTGTYTGPAGADCQDQNGGIGDEFTVAVYALDSSAYRPGPRLGQYQTQVRSSRLYPRVGPTNRQFFDYELTLLPGNDPLPSLTAGEMYFVEVSNSTPGGAAGCHWWWIEAGPLNGNGLAFQNRGGTFTEEDAVATDMTVCLNVSSSVPEPVTRACCTSDSLNPCRRTLLETCRSLGGRWTLDREVCDSEACPLPSNDRCEDAVDVSEGPVAFDNFGATTDGPAAELCGGDTPGPLGADVWYHYTSTCTGPALVSTCNPDYPGDEAISIYHDSANPTVCPCPGDAGFQLLQCQNGGQPNYVNPMGCQAQGAHAEVVLPAVTADHCYTVRVSGAGGAFARGELRITCGGTAFCGNGIVEPLNGEECDEGMLNSELRTRKLKARDGLFSNSAFRLPHSGGPDGPEAFPHFAFRILHSGPACPGECQPNCLCPTPVCGDGMRLGSEECDGPEDASCGGVPGRCQPDCTCPPVVCGNNFVDPGEECDEGMLNSELGMRKPKARDGLFLPSAFRLPHSGGPPCPGRCRLPGDPAGECTCGCEEDTPAPDPVGGEPGGVYLNRFVAVVVPQNSAGKNTALRVVLSALNHPRYCCTDGTGTSCNATTCAVDSHCSAAPFLACAHEDGTGIPDYSPFEGKVRYVNSFGGGLTCPDDASPFNTSYKCATLGCEPEYRDWATELSSPGAGQPPVSGLLFITGDCVPPSSTLSVSHLAESCGDAATANTCQAASSPYFAGTARWADVTGPGLGPPDGKSDVLDIPAVTNKLKGVNPMPEPRLWLKQRDPVPSSDAINVLDLSDVQDGGPQGKAYPASRTIAACWHD